MAAPRITIRSQSRLDKTITVNFVVTGAPTSVTVELPAAAVPNGAVGKPAMAVTLNAANEGAATFTALTYGDYAPAVVTASNADGQDVATSWPMKLYAPGTAPVGMPRALLPPFVAPAFTSAKVAIGAVVTDFTLDSTASADQANVPFTFGQPFKLGDLAPGDYIVGRIDGEPDIPLQINVKATHLDGSVRHAIISGLLPELPAGASKTIQIVRAASGTSTAAMASSTLLDNGFSAQVTLTIDGLTYTAAVAEALAGTTGRTLWLGGALVNDYIVNVPLMQGATAHPHLTAQFSVRRYAGTNKAKIDVVVEHTKAYESTADISYAGSVVIAGVVRMAVANLDGTPLIHYPCARWKRSFWWNNDKPVHIRHNFAYLTGTGALPNYDPRVVADEDTLAGYVTTLQSKASDFHLMNYGLWQRVFGETGGRPDIALLPMWYAMAVISQDKRAKDMMLALADCAGHFNMHRRDTSEGPGKSYPLSVVNFPRATEAGTQGDSKNTATGLYEKFPSFTSISATSGSPKQQAVDTSHQAGFAYAPYLVTGDYFYLEELQFWAQWNMATLNPALTYRGAERGWISIGQVRSQGWCLRTLGEAAAFTPDEHPSKAGLVFNLQCNLSRFNELYTDNPDANKLGIISSGGAVIYDMKVGGTIVKGVESGYTTTTNTGIGVFQDDFVSQSAGHVAELGYPDAARFRDWKAKFVITRMIGPGVCWINAASPYSMMVRPAEDAPFFETVAEAQRATLTPAMRDLPCNSPERLAQINLELPRPANDIVPNQLLGYSYSTTGFPSNYQPALAMCVDANVIPDSDLAWDLYDTSAVRQKYGTGPQFAIVPRTVALASPEPGPGPDEPPPPPTPDEPDPLPPTTGVKTMALADRVQDSTTTTGTGPFTMALVPEPNFRVWLTAPIQAGDRVPYRATHRTLPEWENGFAIVVNESTLDRVQVTASSNNNELVNFSEGIKDVACDLTASFVDTLAGAHNITASGLAGPDTTMFIVMENGVPKLVAVKDAGVTFSQLPPLPLPVLGGDEIPSYRNGTDYRTTITAVAAAVKTIIDAAGPPPDTTSPLLTGATASSTGTSTANGSVTTDEANGTLYCLASTSNTATAVAVKTGTAQAIASAGTKNFSIAGLAASTLYYLHYLHRDAAGNDSAIATSASFTTSAVGDTTAPILSAPSGTATGSTTANGSVTTNEAGGTLYRLASTNPAPTANTVKAANLTSVVTASGAQAVSFTGLAAATQYYAHYVHRDAAGNDSLVVSSPAFATATGAIDYTVTGNAGNAIFATMDGSDANRSNATAYTGVRGFAYSKYAASPYWNITPPSGAAAPTAAWSGWSNSATVPPEKITTSQNQAGASSINGATPMLDPNAWSNTGNYLWIPVNSGTTKWYYWVLPEGGIPKCVNPSGMTVTADVAAVAPDAPTIGTAVGGDGYIDVAFTAPASNGGSAILDYTATLSTGETNIGTTSPIRVACSNGTARTATVKARNTVGPGPASAASNSVTPAAAVVYTYTRAGGGSPFMSGAAIDRVTTHSTNSGYVGYDIELCLVGTDTIQRWGVSPVPTGDLVYMGFGNSNTVPPGRAPDGTTITGSALRVPGGKLLKASTGSTITNGKLYSHSGYLWAQDVAGTSNWYFWIDVEGAAPLCINPNNPCVLTLS